MGDREAQNINGVSGQAPEALAPPPKPKRNRYAFALAALASMNAVVLGYDIGVMSGAGMYIQHDLKISDLQLEILMGILNVYSLVGSALAGRTSDWIGRRYTLVLASTIFFFGSLLMGFATNYTFLMVGRFVAGIGVGYGLMIAPVYTTEVSPASIRGFLTSFPEVFVNFGILLGYVSNVAFSKLPLHLGWRFMLGVAAIPSVFLAVGLLSMPESPRWLVLQGRLGDAKRILDRTSDSKEEAQLRLADIKEVAGIPQECNDDVVQIQKRNRGEGVWRELLLHPTPTVRHILIAGIGIHFFQQTSGIDAVVLYSPKIFEKAGITSNSQKLLATVAVGFVKTSFILVATFLLDRIGRRPLLLSSAGGMIASLATLGITLTIIDHSGKKLIWAIALAITSVLTYVASFSIGMGPITWVYSSEIFPLRLRAQGVSMGVAVNRTISGLIGMSFISLYKAVTIGGAFFIFMAVAVITWTFVYTLLPETQGKSLEEIQALFGTFFKWRSIVRELENNKRDRVVSGDGNINNHNHNHNDCNNDNDNGQIQMETING
ncbi:putative polyol transporter 1 [Diospyros lotus]|uniref:putative polyol transporter 1 n=1 Tax=Diospyros lotus TaxID=55363 RepID=UPI00224D1379|nr:putative polyol transporter 1 [Diospyros lotus]